MSIFFQYPKLKMSLIVYNNECRGRGPLIKKGWDVLQSTKRQHWWEKTLKGKIVKYLGSMRWWRMLQILSSVERLPKYKGKRGCISKNIYDVFNFFLFRCFINLNTGEVLHRPQIARNLFLGDEKQVTLWAAQSLNMKITEFGYLGINLASLMQY